ncbi:hypothetical protein MVEN_01682000 [Mycena venus]|uniref:Uncharacterized protein n=1 Tax=Mycena venus TaxID=2733690 RepID=A0A8H7CQN2_9AGAR|nr:hypothetical protein MVEN_01682000 [Mycena venus]
MECVVAYLQSIHWESAGGPLDLAELKLTRVADELEHLCRKQPTITTREKDSCTIGTTDDGSTGEGPPRGPAFEAAMDRIFDAAVYSRKPNSEYQPRKRKSNLSEEEVNFDQAELDKPATPEGRKRKTIVIDNDNSSLNEQLPAVPTDPPAKKTKEDACAQGYSPEGYGNQDRRRVGR